MTDNNKVTAEAETLYDIKSLQVKQYILSKVSIPFDAWVKSYIKYIECPSIGNGSNRQHWFDNLNKALRKVAGDVMEKWNITPEQFDKIAAEITEVQQ